MPFKCESVRIRWFVAACLALWLNLEMGAEALAARLGSAAAYAVAWGVHQGIVVEQHRANGTTVWTTIHGLPSKVTFTGHLWLRIKNTRRKPYYAVGRSPQETNPEKVEFLLQNAKQLQQQLNETPLKYNAVGPNVVRGEAGTSNQLAGALWHSIDVYPTPVLAPGFNIDLPSVYSVPQF